jgi:hypothetical protein
MAAAVALRPYVTWVTFLLGRREYAGLPPRLICRNKFGNRSKAMSLKKLGLNFALVTATSLIAVMLAGYLCSAAMARAGHTSQISKTLVSHTAR